jgi:hypothetical protein
MVRLAFNFNGPFIFNQSDLDAAAPGTKEADRIQIRGFAALGNRCPTLAPLGHLIHGHPGQGRNDGPYRAPDDKLQEISAINGWHIPIPRVLPGYGLSGFQFYDNLAKNKKSRQGASGIDPGEAIFPLGN